MVILRLIGKIPSFWQFAASIPVAAHFANFLCFKMSSGRAGTCSIFITKWHIVLFCPFDKHKKSRKMFPYNEERGRKIPVRF